MPGNITEFHSGYACIAYKVGANFPVFLSPLFYVSMCMSREVQRSWGRVNLYSSTVKRGLLKDSNGCTECLNYQL